MATSPELKNDDVGDTQSRRGSLPAASSLRLNPDHSLGHPQPSPLSQSISAGETTSEAPLDVDLGAQNQVIESSAKSVQDDPELQEASTGSKQPPQVDDGRQRRGSMAAVMQGREPDPIPGAIHSSTSGRDSPHMHLEKDYHKEKRKGSESGSGPEAEGNSGDEHSGSRGRQKGREKKEYRRDSTVSASDTDGGSTKGSEVKQPAPRKLKTFEPLREKQERAKSTSEPIVTITGPGGEKINVKKGPVHPNTNYDRIGSRGVSPNLSDSEEMRDIKHAQSLAIYTSPIDNITPRRVIRTILRGDYRGIQEQAKAKKRKLRTYFVATDLSEEAAYALEWTIGTVLRDGDTLLAIYAVNEETGTGKTGDPERIDGLELSEGAMAMQDTTATMERMTSETPRPTTSPPGSAALAAIGFGNRARRDSDRGSKESRVRSKGDAERLHAIDMIGETCITFLRKTRLQVRVTVEVISCKSPRHMITEAIDFFEPTLVILGSRGRGALKGTLLGSFSNYLVAKSSIPVMVARKRLRGRKAKNVNPTVRLANNLIPTTDSRLTRARID
ncbi:MAG: hypothetical protein Q9220_005086 [cf. Caloplaca sp. 1 TL-2023]